MKNIKITEDTNIYVLNGVEVNIYPSKEPKEMIVHVPFPWMWEEVERWMKDNGVVWSDGESNLYAWYIYTSKSCIYIDERGNVQYGNGKASDEKPITFHEFCQKTGHKPQLWGVRGGENTTQLKELFNEIQCADLFDRFDPSLYFYKFKNSHLLFGISESGLLYGYDEDEIKELNVKEVSIKEAAKKLGRPVPESRPTAEELIKEAEERYPAGTRFKAFGTGEIKIASGEYEAIPYENSLIISDVNLSIPNGDHIAMRAYGGRWAEVIERPVFTNSIGQHFYESEENEVVYWWSKDKGEIFEIDFYILLSNVKNTCTENNSSSEIFKTKFDALRWAEDYYESKSE